MTQKQFQQILKSVFKGKQVHSKSFWLQLQEQNYEELASQYCQLMVKHVSNSKKKTFIIENQQKIYATLLAIQFYKNRKPKAESIIKQCKSFIQKEAKGHNKYILDVFSSKQKEQEFVFSFMKRLAMVPQQIGENMNPAMQIKTQQAQTQKDVLRRQQIAQIKEQSYYKIKKDSYPLQIRPQSKAITFAYICFLDHVRINNNQLKQQEYRQMLSIMQTLHLGLKGNNETIYYMCSFLHFVINCLTFYSCLYRQILQQMLICAEQLQNCWGMIGQLGGQLVQLLRKQIKIPGHAFRKKLRQDFPCLDIKQKQVQVVMKEFYLITDSDDLFTSLEDRSLVTLRKLVVWHMMKVIDLDPKNYQFYMQLLKQISNDTAFHLYYKAMRIVDISMQMQVQQKIQPTLKQHAISLSQQIKKRLQVQGRRVRQQDTQQLQFFMKQENKLNIFKYPFYEIVHQSLQEFAQITTKASFYSIVKNTKLEQLTFYRNSIPLVFYGKSQQFSDFVQGLANFLEKIQISEYKQLQVYYLPKTEVSNRYEVGAYIAAKDIWYRRFVYNVFKQKVIFPYLELTASNKTLFPAYLACKSLHMYLRQAKRIFELKVYQCILGGQEGEQIKRYFTSWLTIGIFTQAQLIRRDKLKKIQNYQNYSLRDEVDIIKRKLLKKYTALRAHISIQYFQAISNRVMKTQQKNLNFIDLQICNLPKNYFMGGKPDPSGGGLKFSLLPQSNSKVFWKQLFNNENFSESRTHEEIHMAFSELFINYTIKSMELHSDADLNVLVDGVFFSKIRKIKIMTPQTINGLPLTIPIYTFLPFK